MAELDTKKIVAGIEKLFADNNHFVFWYDAQGEFADNIANITEQLREPVIIMGKNEQFKTKLTLVAMEQQGQSALVYSPAPKPDLTENFMTDMLYYSREYTANALVMLRQELRVPDEDAATFQEQKRFFASKDRQAKFQRLYQPGKDLQMAIMAALAGASDHTMTMVLRAVLQAGIGDANPVLAEFEKYGLLTQFWENVRNAYGFNGATNSLLDFTTALYLNFAYYQMEKDLPRSIDNYKLTSANNAVIFLSLARNDQTFADTYRQLAEAVWQHLESFSGVSRQLQQLDIVDLLKTDVFANFDRQILAWVVERLQADDFHAVAGTTPLADVLTQREKMYFGKTYHDAYALLQAALVILTYRRREVKNLAAAKEQYITTDYAVDTAYRHFVQRYDRIAIDITDLLEGIADKVDNTYVNEFLTPTVTAWTTVFDPRDVEPRSWQRSFYRTFISYPKERIVVIISDAFRFEAAAELKRKLDDQDVYSTELDTVYSGLPSVTYFGMPALLPHQTLTYQPDKTVLVDGLKADTLEKRRQILQNRDPQSNADHVMTFLKDWDTPQRKQLLAGQKVVYLYHNEVDATGDDAKTEKQVFNATEEAINTIARTIGFLRNLSVAHIIVTADHGYLYKRSGLDSADKIDISGHDLDVLGQRYAISSETIEQPGVRSQRLGALLNNVDQRRVYYPATDSIFKSAGAGQNYVHGGASPEEMIVPVLHVRTQSGRSKATPVSIKVTEGAHRITSRSVMVPISQEEPVTDKTTAATYVLYFVDSQDRPISNEQRYVADSREDDPQSPSRRQSFYLTLQDRDFDNSGAYYLIIQNAETKEEIQRIQYQMDLTIKGDFGFDI